ncbi:MAG: enoyl-CoA hydratase/isomerase family protein [Phycisphaerales bacterium JB037]
MADDTLRVEHETEGEFAGVATLWLDQPGRPVVVLDEALIHAIDRTLDTIPETIRGLVLASASERSFVAGADLKGISQLDDPSLHAYLKLGARVFARFATAHYPTAAAVQGAALGGGLELAMHCDAVIGAPNPSGKPYPVGLPEAGLKICPGWGGTNLLPARIEPADAIRRTATGSPMNYDEAVNARFFDTVAPAPDALLETAKRWVSENQSGAGRTRDGAPTHWIGRGGVKPAALDALDEVRAELGDDEPAASVLDAVEVGLTQGWNAALQAERDHLVRLRSTRPAVDAIAAFFARSAKK